MFYRTDIMEELGIDAEKDVNTWEDVLKTLPILQKNSMSFAIPSVERKINNVTNPDLANYYAQLYQRGGTLYDADAMETVSYTHLGSYGRSACEWMESLQSADHFE